MSKVGFGNSSSSSSDERGGLYWKLTNKDLSRNESPMRHVSVVANETESVAVTFHDAGVLNAESQPFLRYLNLCFRSEAYASQQQMEMPGRAGHSAEERWILSMILHGHKAGQYGFEEAQNKMLYIDKNCQKRVFLKILFSTTQLLYSQYFTSSIHQRRCRRMSEGKRNGLYVDTNGADHVDSAKAVTMSADPISK